MAHNNTSRRGFGGMNLEQRRAIASMGGKAAHLKGTAHEFSSAEAQVAGSKGGKASHGLAQQKQTELHKNNNSDEDA